MKLVKWQAVSIQILLLVFLMVCTQCRAEKIYYKDGSIEKAEIVSRTQNSIWIKNKLGAIGIDPKNIIKIENNDGSVSKFDFPFLIKQIQEFIKQKNYTEAEKSCSLFLNISPENTEVRFLSAILNQKIGDTAEAVKDYNFLINHKNADARVFNNLGAIYAKEKRYKEAKELFYKAIKINPDKAEFHNNLSELLMETEDNDRAIEEYDKVIQLEPGNTLALFNLGIAYKNKGDFAKAKEQWNKVLALKPDDTNAKNALEYLEKNGQN